VKKLIVLLIVIAVGAIIAKLVLSDN